MLLDDKLKNSKWVLCKWSLTGSLVQTPWYPHHSALPYLHSGIKIQPDRKFWVIYVYIIIHGLDNISKLMGPEFVSYNIIYKDKIKGVFILIHDQNTCVISSSCIDHNRDTLIVPLGKQQFVMVDFLLIWCVLNQKYQ